MKTVQLGGNKSTVASRLEMRTHPLKTWLEKHKMQLHLLQFNTGGQKKTSSHMWNDLAPIETDPQ